MKGCGIGPRIRGVILVMGSLMALASCSSEVTLIGNWQPDDGSGVKVITESGQCQGMFYAGGKPLDIGGGMTCSMSEKKNDDGRYSLVVSQPPNRATYYVEFVDSNTVDVYDSKGSEIYSMSRD